LQKRQEKGEKGITPDDVLDMKVRAWTGTALISMLALAAFAALGDDPDDPWFDITGLGPSDPKRKNQLRETGWTESTVKIGDTRFSYQYTPFSVPFSILGSFMDYIRYERKGNSENEGALSSVAFALMQGAPAILDQTFLSSGIDLLGALSATNPDVRANKLETLFARTGTTFLVPNAAKQVKRLFDPTLYDTGKTLWGAVYRELPIPFPTMNREILNPQLNALGEEVKLGSQSITLSLLQAPFRSPDRLGRMIQFNPRADDKVWNFIGDKGLRVPTPSRQTMLQGMQMTDEQFAKYVTLRGQALRQWMAEQISSGAWESMSAGEIQTLLDAKSKTISRDVKARLATSDSQSPSGLRIPWAVRAPVAP
jgi:hypothetical protein